MQKLQSESAFLRKAFSSPDRESHEQAAKRARITEQKRAKILRDISEGLENVADYPKIYQALYLCRDSRLTYEDAQIPEFRIGNKVLKVIKDKSSCPSAVALGKLLMANWVAEKRMLAETQIAEKPCLQKYLASA